MTLIVSVSGIRGTIGGRPGEGLTPDDVVAFCSAYATLLKETHPRPTVVVGRDGRLSGPMVTGLVTHTLQAHGVRVVDIGLAATPTTAMAVPHFKAHGGIIVTASHNPEEWNALKLLDARGEFIPPARGEQIRRIAEARAYAYAPVSRLGTMTHAEALAPHVAAIARHPLVDVPAIRRQQFRVIVDAINSVGTTAFMPLLRQLGIQHTEVIHSDPLGHFAHNPEPLPAHLHELARRVRQTGADLGIAVDPDADRLVLVDENGAFPGEEYTLVMVADYVLQHDPGPTVSNTASTTALRLISERYGQKHYESPVGEWHVVQKMKEVGATIGGEGNGGIIDPRLHYGRDALVGTALILSYMARSRKKLSEIRAAMPDFVMTKEKIPLQHPEQADRLIVRLREKFGQEHPVSALDGLKIFFPEGWVLLRKSNTEPIIRIIAEARTPEYLDQYLARVKKALNH